jgi:rubrerythrin
MEDPVKALAVIRGAIQNEIAGQRFYNDAAYHCIDPWAKETFSTLAREEEKHTLLLLGEHQSLTSQGRWLSPQAALELGASVDITGITFSGDEPGVAILPAGRSAGEAIDRRADDLEALAFGLQIEKRSIAVYQQEADAAVDSAAREAYRFLVEEERRHYRQLKVRWESLAGRPWQEDAF